MGGYANAAGEKSLDTNRLLSKWQNAWWIVGVPKWLGLEVTC